MMMGVVVKDVVAEVLVAEDVGDSIFSFNRICQNILLATRTPFFTHVI